MINNFRGKYRFLSNFYQIDVTGTTVEHLYQAAKTLDQGWVDRILNAETPLEAKRLGRQAPLRYDWEQVKVTVMYKLVWEKFQHPALKQMLLATGDQELIEGNTWGDTFWGICNGKGQNHLGKILMNVRNTIRENMSE